MSNAETTSPILVVEDDVALRQIIRWTLEDAGLPVETAADGRQALDWLERNRPSLVVLDVGLPIVNGDGVAAGLHGLHGRTVPILIITADGHAAEKARRVGAFDFLHKPFDLDDLVTAVKQELQAG